jgi:hypothetical protein
MIVEIGSDNTTASIGDQSDNNILVRLDTLPLTVRLDAGIASAVARRRASAFQLMHTIRMGSGLIDKAIVDEGEVALRAIERLSCVPAGHVTVTWRTRYRLCWQEVSLQASTMIEGHLSAEVLVDAC